MEVNMTDIKPGTFRYIESEIYNLDNTKKTYND